MAIIGKEKYNQEKIDKLHDYLKMYQDMGQPIDFEVLVDGFKAVRRTANPDMFRLFENFVNGETKSIEVLFYQGSSNNNDKHLFTFAEEEKSIALSGIEVDNRINEQVNKARKDWEFEQLKKDNEEWEEYAGELQEEIDHLKKELQEVKADRSPLHGFLGEFGSSLVSGLVRENPKLAGKIPGLSGLVEPAISAKDSPAPGSDIHFTSADPAMSPEANEASSSFVMYLREHFKGEQFDQLMGIIDLLAASPEKISFTLDQLKQA
jgi:hypothetical protein